MHHTIIPSHPIYLGLTDLNAVFFLISRIRDLENYAPILRPASKSKKLLKRTEVPASMSM